MKRLYRIFITLLAFGLVPLLLLTALQFAQDRRLQSFMEASLQEAVNASPMPPPPALQMLPQTVLTSVKDYRARQFIHQVAVILLLGAALAVLAFRNARRTTRTLRALIDAWQRLGEGDFAVRLDADNRDERDAMIEAFNTTVPKLEDHFQTRQALAVAQQVQRDFLPAPPDAALGLDVAFTNMSCDDTGGDYVDIIPAPGGDVCRLLFTMGDVSGHGIGPALLMASARGALRAMSLGRHELADRAGRLNRLMAVDAGDSGHFMTLFLAELDTASGTLEWVRAGHDPAYLFDPHRQQFLELDGPGVALGLTENARFETQTTAFAPGQILVMATDGIWETRNRENVIFGKKRLREVIRRQADQPAAMIKAHIIEAISAFRDSARQDDDITLMVVKRRPAT
jgi:sigma-B regulation protein RsbU (phosphoserine phosphatase)